MSSSVNFFFLSCLTLPGNFNATRKWRFLDLGIRNGCDSVMTPQSKDIISCYRKTPGFAIKQWLYIFFKPNRLFLSYKHWWQMCVCACTCENGHAHAQLHVCMYTREWSWTCTAAYVCACTRENGHEHAQLHMCVHVHVRMVMNMHS